MICIANTKLSNKSILKWYLILISISDACCRFFPDLFIGSWFENLISIKRQLPFILILFKVEKNEEFGRYMVATRPIKAFEPVILDQALAFGPCEHTKPRCLACLKQLNDVSTVCPECNLPMCDLEVMHSATGCSVCGT